MRACTICTHPERHAIEREIVTGGSKRRIAAQHGLVESSVRRHAEAHLPVALLKAQDAREVAQGDNLLADVRDLQRRTLRLLEKAEGGDDLRAALTAIGVARANVELLARLLGELQDGAVINLTAAPEWAALRTRIIAALAPYPDARLAVAEALDVAG